MAVAFGKINTFNPSQDEWPLYVERLEHVFIDKLLSSLVAPAKPGEREYSALVDKLTEHFTPAPLEIVERYKFHTRFRKSGVCRSLRVRTSPRRYYNSIQQQKQLYSVWQQVVNCMACSN